jgi:hydroxylaminobenzene mutase
VTVTLTRESLQLLFWGALLFFLGLVQGGAIPAFENPRMALSAHLAAVQSGMALMIFGLAWSLLALGAAWRRAAFWAAILSMYLVWIAITLGAAWGASRALPLAGAGFSASPVEETAVEAIVGLGAVLGLYAGGAFALGLFRGLSRNR